MSLFRSHWFRRGSAFMLWVFACQGAMANNVQVRLEGTLVTIFGDNAANSIVVSQNAAGDFVVTGQAGTRVNGRASVSFPRLQLSAAEVRMEGGNDSVTLRGVRTTSDLFVDLGAGADRFAAIERVSIGANLTVEGGAGSDLVQLNTVTVFEDLFINGGLDALRAQLANVDAAKSVTIIGDAAADAISVTNSAVDAVLAVESKGGADSINVSAVVAFSLVVDTADGVDSIGVQDLLTTEDVGIFTGVGNDTVRLTRVDSGKSITVSVDAGQDNVVGTEVIATEDAVFEGGAGTDTISDFGIAGGIKTDIKEFEVLLP